MREFEKIELTDAEKEKKLREEIKPEFEATKRKEDSLNAVKEFMEKNKNKITPRMKEVLTDNVLTEIFSNNYEFGEEKIVLGTLLEKTFEKMPNFVKFGENEFEETNENNYVENAKIQYGLN